MARFPSTTLYDLTDLTRKAGERRRVVIQGFDVDRRAFILFLAGFVPALMVGVLAATLIGSAGIVFGAAVYLPIIWLFATSPRGMELVRWRELRHRTQSNAGHFILRGRRLPQDRHRARVLAPSSIPVPRATADDSSFI